MSDFIEFANRNSLKLSRLHRDIHADCFIPVTISTVIAQDASVKDVSIEKSFTVPVLCPDSS